MKSALGASDRAPEECERAGDRFLVAWSEIGLLSRAAELHGERERPEDSSVVDERDEQYHAYPYTGEAVGREAEWSRKKPDGMARASQYCMDKVQLRKSSKPGHATVDLRAGTCVTLKSYMVLPKHRQFIACKAVIEFFHVPRLSVVIMVARKALDDKSDIRSMEEVRSKSTMFVKVLDRKYMRKCRMVRDARLGSSSTQTFLSPVIRFLSNWFKNELLFYSG